MEKELLDLLAEGDYDASADFVAKKSAEEIAEIIGSMDEKHIVPFSRALDSDVMAEVLVLLSTDLQQIILDGMHDDELEEVMEEISIDDTVEIIEDMPQKIAVRIAQTEEITQLLVDKNFAVLKPLLAQMNEADLAIIFDEMDEDMLVILFRILPKDLAAETFVFMENDTKEKLLKKMNDREVKAVLNELFLDDTVDLVEEMPANVVKRLLALSDKETRNHINEILKYPKDSAGSIMTIEYASLHPEMTVEEAFERIRKTAIDKETIYTLYVKDRANKLIGLVSAKDLMIAHKTVKIKDIMTENVIYAYTEDDKEEVANKISDYGFLALPIVDREMRLLGIVTVDDAIEVIKEESTEDIEKMAAMTPSDKPYLKTNVFAIFKNRLPWLLILMLSATFTGLILNSYEAALSGLLVACVPMIMGTGGNSGSQAAVTVTRSLALGELEAKDVLKVIWKELRVSLMLGIVLGVACFGKLLLIDNLVFGNDYDALTSLVVSLALTATVVIAKLVGCILPILAKVCHLDPAVVASPFITTIVDVVSLLVYCALVSIIL